MAFGAQWSLHFARTAFFWLQLSITAILYSLYQSLFEILFFFLEFRLIVPIFHDYVLYHQIKISIRF